MSAQPEGEEASSHGLTEDQVRTALVAEKGGAAQLTSWRVVDFGKKGDGYGSVITSVQVIFKLHGKEQNSSYVVKMSAKYPSSGFTEIIQASTWVESQFFKHLAPKLTRELVSIGQPSLRIPRCFYTSDEGKRFIFLEDLRTRGFKLYPRHQSQDVAHASLVMQEVARFHGAAFLLQAKTPHQPLHHQYPHLTNNWFNVSEDGHAFCQKFMRGTLDSVIVTLEKVGGYSAAIKWLQDIKPHIADVMEDEVKGPSPFTVLCHADVWTNNMLFRYDEGGEPVEVMLLDHQLTRVRSLATDINTFFFTSLDGSVRRQNLNTFLDIYYNALQDVLKAGHLSVPFTRQELLQEYRHKHVFGALRSLWSIPTIIAEESNTTDFSEMPDETMGNFMEKQDNTLLHNPLLKPRLLSMFDEFMECGLMK